MNNTDTILVTVIICLGGLTYFVIRDHFTYVYSADRKFRKHKKTGLLERKTYNGWQQI